MIYGPARFSCSSRGYTERAFELYTQFQIIDYLFPVVAGMLLATVSAFALRHASPEWYDTALRKNLFVVILIPTVFDFLENFGLLRARHGMAGTSGDCRDSLRYWRRWAS